MAKKANKKKRDYLKSKVEHIDITKIDAVDLVNSMKKMSFSARDLATAAEMYNSMLADRNCVIFLTIAGSTSAAGCMQIYADMVRHNMVDAIVATGASIVDMDFFEALGFSHYQGTPHVDDSELRSSTSTASTTPTSTKSSFSTATKPSPRSPMRFRPGPTRLASSSRRWADT